MFRRYLLGIALLLIAPAVYSADAGDAGPLIERVKSGIPFSFVYGGKPSKDILPSWKRVESEQRLVDGRTRHLITFTDPSTRLAITEELISFPNRAAIEMMLWLKNGGIGDTPILENILPLDLRFTAPGNGGIIFHHVLGSASRRPTADGSDSLARDYSPIDESMEPMSDTTLVHYVMKNGVHVESYLPFFNMQWKNGGLIGAVGWTGQWMVRSRRDARRNITLQAGQQTTHLKLHPGESIRTPRILLIGWQGRDWLAAQNELRRLLVAYYLPRINGHVAMPPVAHTGAYVLIFDAIAKTTGKNPLDILPTLRQSDLDGKHGYSDPNAALNYVTEKNQLALVNKMPDVGIEAYWLDAGWFVGLWPNGRGSWVPNKNFPGGLKPLADAAHKRGMKFLLWFDPEGVGPESIIAKEHPEWVLHQPDEGRWGGIFRFSDPAALKWMIQLLSDRIRDWNIDIYRNDRNTCPLPFWEAADTPDRKGITEIRQIEGLYALWDALRQRFPKLVIDNANWRITGPDLEAMTRTIGSLTRSELTSGGLPHPTADQAQTQELSLWIPLDSNLLHAVDPYNFRSTATTGVGIGLDLQSPYVPIGELKKAISELKDLRPYWLGDYYPLTKISLDDNAWSGWQFNRPDLGEGFAVLFRRPKSAQTAMEMDGESFAKIRTV